MSDVTPNYQLELQRLELEQSQLKLNIQSQQFRIAQILDERDRIEENIEATHKSVAELDKQITKLKEKTS